ncbi:MAG: Fe-S protein assembly co-chaperone HscB [Bacteroidales bacterium]
MSTKPDSHGVTIQACKHCGAGAPLEAHFCPQCDKILSFVRHGDYFAFLGLPRKLRIDLKDLDKRLRTLSRQFHPDYYCNATASERLASLERASYLNDAYRTLRDRLSRVEYLLQIEGVPLRKRTETTGGVPAALLEEVFALNEELDAVREARAAGTIDDGVRERLAAARAPIDRHVAEHEQRLEALIDRWDDLVDRGVGAADRRPVLEDFKRLLLERNYVNNLLAAIELINA